MMISVSFNGYFQLPSKRRILSMETFGRGCLYIMVGIIVLTIIAMITRSSINIPLIVLIPLLFIAFWAASQKTKSNSGDAGGFGGDDDDDSD